MSLFNARHFVPSLLAFATAGFISSTASALVFGGNFFVPGLNRIIATNVVQNMSSAHLPALDESGEKPFTVEGTTDRTAEYDAGALGA